MSAECPKKKGTPQPLRFTLAKLNFMSKYIIQIPYPRLAYSSRIRNWDVFILRESLRLPPRADQVE